MSYQVYNNLSTPDEVLEVMSTYLASRGYVIIADCVDDLEIYGQASSDGKKLVVRSRNLEYFYIFRTANGQQIFATTDESALEVASPIQYPTINGIGVIVSEGYSPVARWYNQGGVPLTYRGKEVLGGFMPVANKNDDGDPTGYTFSLYCNNVTTSNADTIVFSLVKEDDTFKQCTHIIVGQLSPYGTWTGGAFFSASATREMVANCWKCYEHKMDADQYILPVLCSGNESNTFLRMDIDAAPTAARGYIYWASSGLANETGKRLSLPIRLSANGNGKIPNYYLMQSKDMFDWGRNVNTLNCLSINLPIYFAVQLDPNGLNVYSAAGQALGIYFVCTLNMQTAGTYKLNYPSNTDICQVFPMGKRRGTYGYDGISIKQEIDSSNPIDTSVQIFNTDYMESVAVSPPIFNINNTTTGIRAYGGDTAFTDGDLNRSDILLSTPYTSFNTIVVQYTEDGGNNPYTVTWSRVDLAAALAGSSNFDLTKGQTSGIYWRINPTNSTTTKLAAGGQNCGIMSIIGYST